MNEHQRLAQLSAFIWQARRAWIRVDTLELDKRSLEKQLRQALNADFLAPRAHKSSTESASTLAQLERIDETLPGLQFNALLQTQRATRFGWGVALGECYRFECGQEHWTFTVDYLRPSQGSDGVNAVLCMGHDGQRRHLVVLGQEPLTITPVARGVVDLALWQAHRRGQPVPSRA